MSITRIHPDKFIKQTGHVTVKVNMEIVKSGMIHIQQDSNVLCILPKDAEGVARALLSASQFIKDQS